VDSHRAVAIGIEKSANALGQIGHEEVVLVVLSDLADVRLGERTYADLPYGTARSLLRGGRRGRFAGGLGLRHVWAAVMRQKYRIRDQVGVAVGLRESDPHALGELAPVS